MGTSKINLQQGLAASEQQGQPISAKFEVDEGKLQLSVYTAKDGKFSEVLVDYTNGKVMMAEPITEGDDLAAAKLQSAAMAKAKTTLKEAVDKAVTQSGNARVISAVPTKDGRPVVSIAFLDGEKMKLCNSPGLGAEQRIGRETPFVLRRCGDVNSFRTPDAVTTTSALIRRQSGLHIDMAGSWPSSILRPTAKLAIFRPRLTPEAFQIDPATTISMSTCLMSTALLR
jgi:hypothetical protein